MRHRDRARASLSSLVPSALLSSARLVRVASVRLAWAIVPLVLVGCGGDVPTYGPCDDARDCAGDDRCYRLRFDRSDGSEGDGKLCSRPCANDDDCPGEGACLALAGDVGETFLCLERCPELGCFEGLACTPVTGADVGPLCLPD